MFLDIETTGLSGDRDDVTVIGALGNGELALFINGINLEQFPAYIAQFPLLSVSTAASSTCHFCEPIFPRRGSIRPTSTCGSFWPRWGTRAGSRSWRAGLGLRRDPAIQGVDGFEAVRLWYRYRRGDRSTRAADPVQPDRRGQPG